MELAFVFSKFSEGAAPGLGALAGRGERRPTAIRMTGASEHRRVLSRRPAATLTTLRKGRALSVPPP
eukprot:15208918-Alexandrium_andersonii.AAC.1